MESKQEVSTIYHERTIMRSSYKWQLDLQTPSQPRHLLVLATLYIGH